MPRNKKKSAAVDTNLDHAPRANTRTQHEQLPLEEGPLHKDSAPHQPSPPLPEAPFSSIRGQLQAARDRHIATDGETDPLTNDNIRETHRKVWQRIGFYSDHPNHNKTAVNDNYVKSMLEKNHELGKVVAKYRLFINKPTGKHAMLIQYPNRVVGQEYRASSDNKPLEIRIKPKCGLVEVDIPVNIHSNYDKEKGIEYGEALRKSLLLQEGGSYGLGGGLGVGPKPTSKGDRRAPPPEGPSQEKLLENFDDANNKGHVMNKITLGGQIYPFKNGDPIYMAAAFKEGENMRSVLTDFPTNLIRRRLHVDEDGCHCPITAPV